MHAAAPGPLWFPGPHATHVAAALAPRAADAVPAGPGSHSLCPPASWNLPGAHCSHAAAPAPLAEPGAHCAQACSAANVPAAHAAHAVWLAFGATDPSRHARQAEAPLAFWNVPGTQALQLVSSPSS